MSFVDRIGRSLVSARYFKGRDRLLNLVRQCMFKGPRTLPAGFRMNLDPHEWTQFEIILHGTTEPATTDLVQRLIKPGDVVIDVGAHVGFYACLAALACGSTGRVLAVEPQEVNIAAIDFNRDLNGYQQIEVIRAALGAEESVVNIPIQNSRDTARLSLAETGVNDLEAVVSCPLKTIDQLLVDYQLDKIQLMKIDVEGYEQQVLAGSLASLVRIRHIIVEILPGTAEDKRQAVINLLRQSGFELKTVNGEHFSETTSLVEDNLWACRP